MKISSFDADCRYIAAPGTRSDAPSPFGKFLKDFDIELPRSLTLDVMVQRGWIKPILRVLLPRVAFDAWTNYPTISPMQVSECPQDAQWAFDVYVRAMVNDFPRTSTHWWMHEFDEESSQISKDVRSHSVDTANLSIQMPEPFRHARWNQEILPWIDYFAYWQVFQIVDLRWKMTAEYTLTDAVSNSESVKKQREARVEMIHQSLQQRWAGRYEVFDWLSRMRTVLGSIKQNHSQDDIDTALHAVADSLAISPDKMRSGIRNVLLVMWKEWTGHFSPLKRRHNQLLERLRQDIEYSIFYLERITGQPTDFFDEFWYDPRQAHKWARLIDALPREEELAQQDFPRTALIYLRQYQKAIPQIGAINEDDLRRLVFDNWQRNRSLRRFVLACHRLHRELHGQALMESERIIRQVERIEQFNLTMMHAERVLSFEHRERCGAIKYPEIRKLAKDTLNHLLCRWSLGKVSRITQERTQELLVQRAMLHDLDPAQGLPLVSTSDVASGNDTADSLAAMLVNFVIVRNYAAHHDAIDADLVYPSDEDPLKHPGGIAITSVIGAVVSTLLTR